VTEEAQVVGETVVFNRECPAVMVPDGTAATLSEGMHARLTQALGTSFTIVTGFGQMFRVDSQHADAIGKDPEDFAVEIPEGEDLEAQVWTQLGTCYDPEIPVDIVELGLVYSCRVEAQGEGEGTKVEIRMTLTAPGCGMGEIIVAEVRDKILALPEVEEVDVELVFDPPWDKSMMSEEARLKVGLF
jgi:probable FeS assembly SUF system protein SufT